MASRYAATASSRFTGRASPIPSSPSSVRTRAKTKFRQADPITYTLTSLILTDASRREHWQAVACSLSKLYMPDVRSDPYRSAQRRASHADEPAVGIGDSDVGPVGVWEPAVAGGYDGHGRRNQDRDHARGIRREVRLDEGRLDASSPRHQLSRRTGRPDVRQDGRKSVPGTGQGHHAGHQGLHGRATTPPGIPDLRPWRP